MKLVMQLNKITKIEIKILIGRIVKWKAHKRNGID